MRPGLTTYRMASAPVSKGHGTEVGCDMQPARAAGTEGETDKREPFQHCFHDR